MHLHVHTFIYPLWIWVLLQNALSFLHMLIYTHTQVLRNIPHGRQSCFVQANDIYVFGFIPFKPCTKHVQNNAYVLFFIYMLAHKI